MLEIICVGNELLIGKTLNTNAHWLAKRATSLGVMVKRITVIKDDVDEIAQVLREVLRRNSHFIMTTGGLGPTFDDKTLEGIAKGLNRELVVNKEALKMVKEKYESYSKLGRIQTVELTPPSIKMATFPEGAEPLHNAVGTAPGMMLKVDSSFIIALPGVPPEMKAIFDESVVLMLKKEAGKSGFFEKSIFASHIMESNLAPLIDEVMRNNLYVYIKSHVYMRSDKQPSETRPHIELHFSTTAENRNVATESLNKAIEQLSGLIQKNGGKVKTADSV